MGSSPKAPPAPPDPAIAAEKARREAIAIGLADARRTTMYGSSSTIKSQPVAGVDPARPTDAIVTQDPYATPAGQEALAIEKAQAGVDSGQSKVDSQAISYDERGKPISPDGAMLVASQKLKLEKMKDNFTPAEQAAFSASKKDKAIGEYINRTRKRIGVSSTRAAQ